MIITEAIKSLIAKVDTGNVGIFRTDAPLGITVFKMFRSPDLLRQYANDDNPPESALMHMLTLATKYGIPAKDDGSATIAVPTMLMLVDDILADDWSLREFEEAPRIIQPDIRVNVDKNKLHV